MTSKLKTAKGNTLFTATLAPVQGVELHKEGEVIFAVRDGVVLGEVETAKTYVAPGTKGKALAVDLNKLVADIDVAALIGKDPLTLTHEELIALTIHLQSGAAVAAQVDSSDDEEEDDVEEVAAPKAKAKAKKKPAPAPVVEDDEEEEEDEEEDAFELPEGLDTYEAIAALGVKAMWAEIGKHIAAEAGIKARTPKDEMLDAIAEYFELEPAEDEDEEEAVVKPKAKGKSKPAPVEEDEDEDDEEDIGDEFEDDDEEEDDEDEDDFDEDEEEDDEEDDEEFEDDDEEDEEDEDEDEEEVTEEDIDALFEAGNKQAIVAFCSRHEISLPKKKMNANTIKQIIKDALFGEE